MGQGVASPRIWLVLSTSWSSTCGELLLRPVALRCDTCSPSNISWPNRLYPDFETLCQQPFLSCSIASLRHLVFGPPLPKNGKENQTREEGYGNWKRFLEKM